MYCIRSKYDARIFMHDIQSFASKMEKPNTNWLRNKRNKSYHIQYCVTKTTDDKEIDSEDGETDDQSPQPPIQTNINHLTDVLIQEIASYLPFQSYSNFQSCSRSILYAANTPSTLHQLDYSIYLDACINTKDECQIKSFMKRFERVQALSIDGFNEKYIQLMPAQFKNVKHLKLHFVHGFESYGINWKEIRILDCVGYVWNENAVAIIKRCNNLSSLFLNVSRDEQNQLAKTVGGISNLQCLGLHSEVDSVRYVEKYMQFIGILKHSF
eukprot:650827_1